MTVLARYHIQYPGTTTWVDVTSRVIGDAKWTEGRNLTLLGGPLPPAVPATLNCTLDNFDGFFTKGAGSALGPGARFRLQWRATTGDAWGTRYLGRLSEQRVRFQGSSRIAVRWYGVLLHLTGSNIPSRTYGNRTPEIIFGQICDLAGVPMADRDFDTDTETVAITAAEGYPGVLQFADLVNGFIYDTPDGKVRLELPPTRAAKTVSANYSDVPAGAEIGIPPPEVQTNPFGIVNQVDAELRVFSPATGDTGLSYTLPGVLDIDTEWPEWTRFTVSTPLGFLATDGIMTTAFSFNLQTTVFGQFQSRVFSQNPDTTLGNDLVANDPYTLSGQVAHIRFELNIRNWSFEADGDTLVLTFEHRIREYTDGQTPPATQTGNRLRIRDVTATVQDLFAVLQNTETYPYSQIDGHSQTIFGVRRRQMKLVQSLFVADLSGFTPDLTTLEERTAAELARYSDAREAFILETTAATDAERTALLARRLSDKVHLRLVGQSQLSVDADFFVEAMETTIDPVGNVAQRLHVVEDLSFVPLPQLSAPSGLALTEAGGDITAAWNAVTDATGYVLEWREEGSGDAWQTANVAAPPHTFTP